MLPEARLYVPGRNPLWGLQPIGIGQGEKQGYQRLQGVVVVVVGYI